MNDNAVSTGLTDPVRLPDSTAKDAKIMIVDDESGTVELVRFHLGAVGYTNFVACTNASDAFQLVVNENPDVLLLDLVMPETDGLEILGRIRAFEGLANLPVIILTSVKDAQTEIKAIELGATDFLNKPVNFVELVPRIRNALVVKAYHDQLKRHGDELQRQVELKTARLKESHANLQRANLVLRRSYQEAETAARVKGEFLANVSHELRTPLTAIIGFTEELLTGSDSAELPPHSAELAQVVFSNGNHLLQIVNDILDVAKIENDGLPIDLVDCSPRMILEEAVRMLRPMADAKGLELIVETPYPIPDAIHSDPMRLRQILTNLLSNSIKFTERGSIRVAPQLLGGDGPAPKLQFEVIDTGIGIEPDQVAEIFKPFKQAFSASGGKHSGTGLGLTICKYFVEEMGGEIQVKSQPGVGSTFTLTVATGPIHDLDRQSETSFKGISPETPAQTENRSTHGRLSSTRILVAEDSSDNQRLIRMILDRAGAEVTMVADGQAALEEAMKSWRRGEPFDTILTDIQMPVVDGYNFVEQMRGHGYPGPMIALTANAMVSERQKCLDVGCDDYLSKPIDRAQLLSLVARYSTKATTR